ncbi:MAG: MFS transporter, partial [Burkholderiales bacterium]
GLGGLFAGVGVLALLALAVTAWWVPAEPAQHSNPRRGRLADALADRALLRLDFGVFVLHAVQLSMWIAVPAMLVAAGLPKAEHWHVYLPAVFGSFLVLGGLLFRLERGGYLRATFLVAIGLIGLAQLGFLLGVWAGPEAAAGALAAPEVAADALIRGHSLLFLGALLFVFFCGFNVLEATQPSLVSRLAPAHARGAALGAYNTAQSLGLFAGGVMGGALVKNAGAQGLFTANAVLCAVWLLVAWRMAAVARH